MSEIAKILSQQALQDRLVERNLGIPGKNIHLFGKPGTGKTTAARKKHASMFTGGIYSTTVTLYTPASEWRGFFIPKPDEKTGTPSMGWNDGLAAKAMGMVHDSKGNVKIDKPASRFNINEIDKAGPDLEAIIYAVCDDREVAELHLPNGDVIHAQPDFQVVATSNEPPEALLPAIADRFSIRIRVDLPSEEAVETLPADLQEFCLKVAVLDDDQYLSFREIKEFADLRDNHGFDPITAAHSVWGGSKGLDAAEAIVNSYNLAGAAVI